MATLKKMTFKWVDGCNNSSILSCLSNGRVWLTNSDRRPLSLSNVMFASGCNGYKDQENTLKKALKSIIKKCDEKNAKLALAVLKEVTKISTWTLLESNVSVEIEDKKEKSPAKKMCFERKDTAGNCYHLTWFNNGNFFLENDAKVLLSLSNVMFNAGLKCGYEGERDALKQALKDVIKDYSNKNAKDVLSALKKVTRLEDWKIINV